MNHLRLGLALGLSFLLGSPMVSALQVSKQKIILESLDDLSPCAEKYAIGDCLTGLNDWLKAHPKDNWNAGLKVALVSNKSNALPYFAAAFDQKAGNCKEEVVQDATVAGLSLPPNDPAVATAKKLAFATCWSDWDEDLINALSEGENYKKNACPDLKKKSPTHPKVKEKCH
jgi:hypothetical protein